MLVTVSEGEHLRVVESKSGEKEAEEEGSSARTSTPPSTMFPSKREEDTWTEKEAATVELSCRKCAGPEWSLSLGTDREVVAEAARVPVVIDIAPP